MLNQPTSSPMITRMLGFCPCWAEAGMLAIVAVVHNTTSAPEIVLNMLIAVSSMSAAEAPGRSLRPSPPSERLACADPCGSHFGNRSDALPAANWAKRAECAMRFRQVVAPQRDGRWHEAEVA